MGTEENKATLKRYYEEVFNNNDLSKWNEMVDEDYVLHAAVDSGLRGLEQLKQTQVNRLALAPDTKITIDEVIGEGDGLAVRGDFVGTHTGEYQGIPPTGKKFTRAYMGFYRFKNGKIAEVRTVQNVLGMFQQLGVTPPAAPVSASAGR